MATKKYSHIQVILYAVGLWAVSFPILAFWVSTSIVDCTTGSPSTKDSKKETDSAGEKSKFLDKTEQLKAEQLKREAQKKKRDALKKLSGERQASLSFSQNVENSDEPVQIEWQWITKAQMIQLIHENFQQNVKYLEKVEHLKKNICFDKDTEITFDPTYKKIDELTERHSYEKYGISEAQWMKLLKFHRKDPLIHKELKAMDVDPGGRSVGETPASKRMRMEEFFNIHKLMAEQTKEIILQLRWTDEREDSYDVDLTATTINFMATNRAFRKYGYSEDDIAGFYHIHKEELDRSKEYAEVQQAMAAAEKDIAQAADPENWKQKINKAQKDINAVDDAWDGTSI